MAWFEFLLRSVGPVGATLSMVALFETSNEATLAGLRGAQIMASSRVAIDSCVAGSSLLGLSL